MKPVMKSATWHERAAQLRARRAATDRELQSLETARQTEVLAAMLGDTAAQRRLDRARDRGALLADQAAALDQAVALAEAEIARLDAAMAEAAAAAERDRLADLLAARLAVVAKIEQALRDLLTALRQVEALGSEIDRHHAALGGARQVLPPLAPEATGGRLAEFMAGLGYGDFLPLPRPESRAPIASIAAAEEAAQSVYHQKAT